MRVTAETKRKTKDAIVEAARKLFSKKGLEQTTTRDIASAAGIATGTLFNYFPTKEALAMAIMAEALDESTLEFERKRGAVETLDEQIFLFVICGLHNLKPYRASVGAIMETAASPFSRCDDGSGSQDLRDDHLETVSSLIMAHAGGVEPSTVTMHLYWTLYLGVVAFWSKDTSPNQEETLVVLDQALRMFVASLTSIRNGLEVNHGS